MQAFRDAHRRDRSVGNRTVARFGGEQTARADVDSLDGPIDDSSLGRRRHLT
jgi:hypothetical protein